MESLSNWDNFGTNADIGAALNAESGYVSPDEAQEALAQVMQDKINEDWQRIVDAQPQSD
jgi:hypothetical protein